MPKSSLDILRELANRLNEYPPGYTPTQEQAAGQDKEKERWRRLFGTLATSVYGVNPNTGKVAAPFDTETGDIIAPGLVDQTLALPAWFQPVGKALGWNYDPPQWSKDAEKNSDQVLDEIRDRMNYGPPTDTGDYAIESAATMLAQPLAKVGSIDELKAPFRAAGNWAKGALSRFGPAGKVAGHAANATTLPIRAGLEFFGPAIEPSAKNYALGTAFGTGLRSMLGDPEAEQIEYIQKKLEAGKLTQEEAEDKIIALLQSGDKLSEPNNEVPPVTMSKAKGGKIRNLNAARTELKSVLESLYGYIADRVSLDDFDDAISEIQERVKSPALRAELLNVVKRAQSTEDFRTAYPDLNAIAQRYGIPAGEDAHLSMQREGGLGKALEESPPEEPAPHSAPPTTEDELWAMFSRGELSSLEFEDLARQLEKNPPPKKAKGGKVGEGTLLALRQKLASLLGEAGVEGTGKEMVPVDPLPIETNLPGATDINLPDAEFTRPPAETNLPPEQALDSLSKRITEAPVTRRTVLKGLASLANPLPIDPTSIFKDVEPDIQGAYETHLQNELERLHPMKPTPGVIARVNDREGYERSAWGSTPSGARKALQTQLLESGEIENSEDFHNTIDEFGLDYRKALSTEEKSQLDDPLESALAEFRGIADLIRDGHYTYPLHADDMPRLLDPSFHLKGAVHEKRRANSILAQYAETTGKPLAEARVELQGLLKKEIENRIPAGRDDFSDLVDSITQESDEPDWDSVLARMRKIPEAHPAAEKLEDFRKSLDWASDQASAVAKPHTDEWWEAYHPHEPMLQEKAVAWENELEKAAKEYGYRRLGPDEMPDRFDPGDFVHDFKPHNPREYLTPADPRVSLPGVTTRDLDTYLLKKVLHAGAEDPDMLDTGGIYPGGVADYLKDPSMRLDEIGAYKLGDLSAQRPKFEEFMKKHGTWVDPKTDEIHFDPKGADAIRKETYRISDWLDMSDKEKAKRRAAGEDDPWETYQLGGDDDVDYHGGYVTDALDTLEQYHQDRQAGTLPPEPKLEPLKGGREQAVQLIGRATYLTDRLYRDGADHTRAMAQLKELVGERNVPASLRTAFTKSKGKYTNTLWKEIMKFREGLQDRLIKPKKGKK